MGCRFLPELGLFSIKNTKNYIYNCPGYICIYVYVYTYECVHAHMHTHTHTVGPEGIQPCNIKNRDIY